MSDLARYIFVAMLLMAASLPVTAQSKFIVWPKELGRYLRPAGTPGGQANALPQFDAFQTKKYSSRENPLPSDNRLLRVTIG